MASGVKPRVKVPKKAAAGEAVTIKTLISHKMESGQRKDKEGNVITDRKQAAAASGATGARRGRLREQGWCPRSRCSRR